MIFFNALHSFYKFRANLLQIYFFMRNKVLQLAIFDKIFNLSKDYDQKAAKHI